MANALHHKRKARPRDVIGTFRRFGPAGADYEICAIAATRPEMTMRIRVLDSGEELDYRYASIVADPVAE